MLPEVLIYVQTVKKFFKTDAKAKEYFLSKTNEDIFFDKLMEISEENFKNSGDPSLTINQFEEVKKQTMFEKNKDDIKELRGQFYSSPIFGNISLN